MLLFHLLYFTTNLLIFEKSTLNFTQKQTKLNHTRERFSIKLNSQKAIHYLVFALFQDNHIVHKISYPSHSFLSKSSLWRYHQAVKGPDDGKFVELFVHQKFLSFVHLQLQSKYVQKRSKMYHWRFLVWRSHRSSTGNRRKLENVLRI